MTREDAISIMNVIVHMLEEKYDTDRVEDAVDMAIKALKQEPCEDAIGRQTVLDIVNNPLNVRLDEIIRKLPSVTPKQKMGRWIYEKRERLKNETDEGAVYITDYWCKCSKCGGDFGYVKMKDAFCKYCGAKMTESEDRE